MDEVGIPLHAEPGAASPNVLGDPRVVLQVLGDGDPAGKFLRDLAVDPLEQAPALGQVPVAGAVHRVDELGSVEAQAVDVVFLEPHADVIEDILPDLAASVIGPGVPPWGVRPVVVVEVDAAAMVLGPAVELPQVEVTRAQVVVHDVEDHRDALLVGTLDEPLERHRTTIGALHRKDMGGVVAPRPFPCELGHRHDLDRIDAKPLQISQTGRHCGELAGLGGVLLVVERADMQFVEDELVPRREMEVVALPVEARVVDNGVADRGGYLAGIRINARACALRRSQQKSVLIADLCLAHVGVPGAVLLGVHGMRVAVPVVERSEDGDVLGMRRPHAERDAPRVRHGAHARDLRCNAHSWFLTTSVSPLQSRPVRSSTTQTIASTPAIPEGP